MNALSARNFFMTLVHGERERQIQKWGDNNTDRFEPQFAQILGEEFGEVCRAVNDADDENLEDELVQVAAVCCRMFEALRARRGGR